MTNITKVGHALQVYQHGAIDIRGLLAEKYKWPETDARLTVFNKISNVLSAEMLGYAFLERCIADRSWWAANSTLPFDESLVTATGNEFEMFLRIGLIQNMMYATESSFRIFVRAIDPDACKQGNAEFQSIYRFLLRKLNLQTHENLLDMWRNIRNSMHNNGLFMPPSGVNQSINLSGTTYEFVVGRPNEFVTTELLVSLIPDLMQLVAKVVQADELTKLKTVVETS